MTTSYIKKLIEVARGPHAELLTQTPQIKITALFLEVAVLADALEALEQATSHKAKRIINLSPSRGKRQ